MSVHLLWGDRIPSLSSPRTTGAAPPLRIDAPQILRPTSLTVADSQLSFFQTCLSGAVLSAFLPVVWKPGLHMVPRASFESKFLQLLEIMLG